MYYDICPYCGAHLDPGEQCDCMKDKQDHTADKAQEQSKAAKETELYERQRKVS